MVGAADAPDAVVAGRGVAGFATGGVALADADDPTPVGPDFFTCVFGVLEAPRPAVPRYGIAVVGVVDVDRAPAGAEPDRTPFAGARGVGASFRATLFCPTSFEVEALRFKADASDVPFAEEVGRWTGRWAPVAGFGEPVANRGTGGVVERTRALLGSIEERISCKGYLESANLLSPTRPANSRS